jgi:hypothetical protein
MLIFVFGKCLSMPNRRGHMYFKQSSANRDIWLSFLLNMALVVLLFFSSIFTGTYVSNQTLIEAELQSRARSFFQSILTTRSWNARHGGVYVEKRPGMESNPEVSPQNTHSDQIFE